MQRQLLDLKLLWGFQRELKDVDFLVGPNAI
uniref:Uncharacterized protein n=1 Tax=Arundo donax TaxID=35708 RepID=A0A0A9GUZ9_ARUDO